MGNFTNKVLNYRPTWASIQNKPTTISGWLTDVYTKSEVDSIVDDAINDLVNAAPGALDTLNELAAALGDDANFASTVTNSLAGKVSLSGSYSKPAWLTQVAASIVEQSANYRFVTDTEKTTWNGKQDALAGGTNNYLPKWTGTNSIGNSRILDDGTNLSVATGSFSLPLGNFVVGRGYGIDLTNSYQSYIASDASDNVKIGSSGYIAFLGGSGTTEYARMFNNGRWGFKTTTDAGFDFDVNGVGRFSAGLNVITSGTQSISTSLFKINADGGFGATDLFEVFANGDFRFKNKFGANIIRFLASEDFLNATSTSIRANGIYSLGYVYGGFFAGLTYFDRQLNFETSGVTALFTTQRPADKMLVVRGYTSHTGNLTEWQNNGGTALSFMTASGALTLGSTIKTATPSANGAGDWKLGKLIGADGTGATSFLELDIDGVVYILTAKVK